MTTTSEPPPIDYRNNQRPPDPKWAAIAAELRADPGQWHLVGKFRATQVTRIKNGALASFRPAGAFQATARNVDERGRADIYARYVGTTDGAREVIPMHLPGRTDPIMLGGPDCVWFPCWDAEFCTMCGQVLCPRHAPIFDVVACSDGGMHHADCIDECQACLCEGLDS